MNHVAYPFADHGHSGRLGQSVQNHVVVGKDHVREFLLGTMIDNSLKRKLRAAIQVKFTYKIFI